VKDDILIDSETLLVTNFINLKIIPTQSFKYAHRSRIYVCVFIKDKYSYIYKYLYLLFLKNFLQCSYIYCVSKKIVSNPVNDDSAFNFEPSLSLTDTQARSQVAGRARGPPLRLSAPPRGRFLRVWYRSQSVLFPLAYGAHVFQSHRSAVAPRTER
jgi:hypothetical protein